MNNKNKILIGCLALLLVLSVGYALFSETITINGTATAKGSFDITATCKIITESDGRDYYTMGGTGVCDISTGVIKTTSTLNKPTDMVFYEVTLKNSGTIPAKLKNVTSPNNFGTDGQDVNDIYIDFDKSFMAQYKILENECTYDEECEESNFVLGPNETAVIAIMHRWVDSEELDLEEQPSVPASGVVMNYNLSFDFEQVVAN